MHSYPKRTCLEGLEVEIFKLVSDSATAEQWKEWLRVPLEHAAARGNLDLFNKLSGAGADGSAGWRGCERRTLLDAATQGGRVEVVSALLRAGAQPDVNVVSPTSKRSALCTAIMLGHEDIAARLIFAGADSNFQDPVNGMGMLHKAVRHGRAHLASYLLMGGANPNLQDGDGSTPLHIAAVKGLDGIVSDLLLKGADKNARNTVGESPLMLASQHGHLSAANTLLASGANLNFRRTEYPEHSALDCATEKGHVRVLQAILGHGAAVNSCNSSGETALHVGARFDHAGAVHALIDAGADVESKGVLGWTPLSWAAFRPNRSAMLALLQRGANVNATNEDEWTPLHCACFNPKPGVLAAVDLLLRWGADETAISVHYETITDGLDEISSADAPQGEIEKVRLLLGRAPADRTWRRRGWLVMLRSRAAKARAAGDTAVGGRSDSQCGGGSAGVRDQEDGGLKAARRDDRGGASHAAPEQERNHGVGAAEEGVLDLSGVVAMLLGLETEGVFRTVVGYL